ADLVGMTRALICDPELPNKAREGRLDDIRACIACMEGCEGRIHRGLPMSCMQNPVTGREKEWAEIQPAQTPKKVVVVGGGPAGMEAARVAALRGHSVTLLEKQDHLGGQISIAAKAPFRDEFAQIARSLSRQLDKAGVEVKLGVNATPDSILALKPDAVIVATGSTPLVPTIPGADSQNVLSDWDVLLETAPVGQNVVIADEEHHIHGLSVAEFLADRGKKVQILTGMHYVGTDVEPKTWRFLYQRLLEKGVVPLPHT
ncbi:unnamed protein product, partial [marine sediment metagenome]